MYDFVSAEVSTRFFDVMDYLKTHGRITNITAFCNRYQINRRNMMQQKANPMRQIFKPSWLVYLVRDYGVSAEYLLTGKGAVLRVSDEKRAKSVQQIQDLLVTLQ